MQRDILDAYDQAASCREADGQTQADGGAVLAVGRLRREVAAVWGTSRWSTWPDRVLWFRFEASFSRALRTLIRRGVLDAIPYLEHGRPIDLVKRRKC